MEPRRSDHGRLAYIARLWKCLVRCDYSWFAIKLHCGYADYWAVDMGGTRTTATSGTKIYWQGFEIFQ